MLYIIMPILDPLNLKSTEVKPERFEFLKKT